MAAFVTFEDVSKVYHSGEIEIRAVDHISFTIEKGEFCVIVGPSGAGKTTVLNMLGGMDACSGGTITVDGTLVSGFNARQLTKLSLIQRTESVVPMPVSASSCSC